MATATGRLCRVCARLNANFILQSAKKRSSYYSAFSFSSRLENNGSTLNFFLKPTNLQIYYKRYYISEDGRGGPSSGEGETASLIEDLEDIRLLIERRIQKDRSIKNPHQQLLLLDELLKTRLKPDENNKFEKLASQLPPSDLYSLGTKIWSLQNTVGEEAVNTAVPIFRIGAMFGDRNSKYSYGQLLFRGAGGLKADPIEASQMFFELSKEGHPQAQFTLAGMYYSGYGVEQNFDTSYTLYQISGENGVVQSFNALGKMYLSGEGVNKDEKKAVEYFMKGVEKNDPQACMSIAHCYNHGKGVEKDFDEAFAYHKKAADLDYPPGIYNIGTHYFAGKGVELDMKKAAECFQKAADRGFALAEINLGNMYYQGLGVERNVEKAKQLYQKAAPTNRNARLLLEEIEMEEQQLKEESEKDS